MSRYPRERIEARLSYFSIESAHRVFAASRMPLSVQPSPSRFCDGRADDAVLYAALTFETCIAESLIRDRFCWPDPTRASLGGHLDAAPAPHVAAGQALGRSIYAEPPDVDGIIYASRLTGDDCLAVFDRAVDKFLVIDACELKDQPAPPVIFEQGGIQIIED